MSVPKQVKNLSISKKIFWSMAAISTTIIFAILISTCTIIFAKCMALETKSTIQNLDHITMQLDFFLTSVDNYSKTIIANSTVQDLSAKFNTQNQTFNELDQLRLKDEINKIIQSTKFIYSVTIYDPSKRSIASTEVYPSNSSLEGIEIRKNSLWITSQKISSADKNKTVPVLISIKKFYSYNSGKLLGYIEIAIPESSIASIYNTHSPDSSNHICIVNAQGIVQSTDGLYPMYSLYPHFQESMKADTAGYHFIKSKIAFYKYFEKLDWYIISETGSGVFLQPIYTLILISILIAVCGVVICTISSHKIAQTITYPLYKLVHHIQKVIQGKWEPVPHISDQNEISFLFNNFNDMLTAQANLTENLVKEQKMKQKLSLDLLQQQVNPHFLYNTLDNICSLAELHENETLIDVVMNLSKFYRETLSRGSFFVTVEDELSITSAYLNIMHIRYYNKFQFTIYCPDSLKKNSCLKLLLQPIVENCIVHGFTAMSDTGVIAIRVAEEKGNIVFTVCDNGVGITENRIQEIWGKQGDNFGLKNVDQRIKLYYGENYGLTIRPNAGGGCTVTVNIAKVV
jgi:two-component system sensor histidine kinase YesM